MDAEQVYAILLKLINGISSGVSSVNVSGTTLTFYFTNGTSQSMTFPAPENGKDGADGKDGVNGKDGKDGKDGEKGADGKNGTSITSIKINGSNHLICTLSDGSVIDAGELPSGGGGSDDVQMMTEEETLAVLNGGELP